ncbi:transferase [Streptomyces sp. CB02923]|uniref:glycosyltransferase family 2 protein n=1 Tax=Streptomyces sp. CB02923 TaxID=1718985 RepID=UPI00093EBBC6|nr:glycosyltransferase family 2 protein [Streptomyces sp. CB02923]OKI06112.1 transferase [Streptomyces sp. CB02923]
MNEAPEPRPGPAVTPSAQVSIVVIAYNDAALVGEAVRSALAQGDAVTEVIAVDDASTDRTGRVLDDLAREHRRLRVIHREDNSGGCGTPRNDGIRAATGRFVMFLDSDDVLPGGAVDALLDAALRHGTPVTAGLCVRRELPGPREVPWQPDLYREPALYEPVAGHPELVGDTLCVNKLYDRAFLLDHEVFFPDGRFTYEDFVFTSRVLAAAPRIAVVPDQVYIWHVRRSAAKQSISLDRKDVANWESRIEAHRTSVRILADAGHKGLAHAARTKFLDHDLRMYVRELHTRGVEHRREWWRLTRAYLAGFEESELLAARAPARWLARVLLASEAPVDSERITQLAARPGRLLPPYVRSGERPVWSPALPAAELDGLDTLPAGQLPVAIDAEPVLGTRSLLRLRLHELYGRVGAAGPVGIDVELCRRADGRRGPVHTAALTADPAGDGWTAETSLDLGALVTLGKRGSGTLDPWDLTARVHCEDGSVLHGALRATGPGLRRHALPSARHGLLLAQPYATTGGALALRMASGLRTAWKIAARKLRRVGTRGR